MQSKSRPGAPHIRYANNGPDGGGGAGGGYGGGGGGGGTGGGGGVRSAQPPPQQDKAPPQPPLTLHHPNHMISAYHARPSQPPPGGTAISPSYIQYSHLRAPPRQINPRPTATLIPFYPDGTTVNPLCAPFYSSIPIMYQGSGSSENARAPPPPGPYPWPTNPAAPPQVTIMTQPPTPQPNPQQQQQQQPSPYQQNQYATYIPRVHQSYQTGGGGSGSGGGPGVQQAPPTTVLVDQRQMQPPNQLGGGKVKITRKNRIPIIDPDTGMEINLEEAAAAGAGGASGGSGQHIHQDHTGGGGHPHSHLHHATTNQVSSSGNAHIAADFAKQVALAAMNETTRVPRESEEPQVNGPGSGGGGIQGSVPVEEPAPPPVSSSTVQVQQTKRPPVPTPVVSAQAEGTTYDIQSIRNNSNKVEIRSGESSPARSKVSPVQTSTSITSVTLPHHHEPSSSPLMHHQPIQEAPVQQHSPVQQHVPVQQHASLQQHQPIQALQQHAQVQQHAPQHAPVQQHGPVQSHSVQLHPSMQMQSQIQQQHVQLPTQHGPVQQQHVQQHAQIPTQHAPVPPQHIVVQQQHAQMQQQHAQMQQQHAQVQQQHAQVQQQQQLAQVQQQHAQMQQSQHTHVSAQPVPVLRHANIPAVQQSPEHHVQPVQPQVQAQPQPKPLLEQPKQQRRPRDDKKQVSTKPPVQVEEKEEGPRSRTSSGARQQTPVSKDEETTVAPSPLTTSTKASPPQVPVTEKQPLHSQVDKPQQLSDKPQTIVEKQKPAEKQPEKVQPAETVADKVPEVVKPEIEKIEKPPQKIVEKRSSPAPVVPAAPSKPKSHFAEGFSLAHMKVSAKAAVQQAASATASAVQTQAAQQSESSDSTDASHSQVKSLSRTKQKGKHKLREMNQKGVEKEGTDMDAFLGVTPENNNRVSNDLSRLPTTDSKANSDNTNRNNQEIRNTDRPNDRSNDNSLTNSKNLTDSKSDRENSPAQSQADATNNNINNQIAQKDEDTDDSGDDMVTAKNQENSMKNSMEDGELSDGSSQANSQPSLKYQYKDDQWSPLNPEGKKVYDRDFLMKLREDPQSAKKPDITTDLEIFVKEGQMGVGGGGGNIRRNPISHGSYSSFGSSASMRNTSNNILYPEFIRTSSSQRIPIKRPSQGSGGNRGPGGGQRSLKSMHSWNNVRDEYRLNLSENAWKPSKLSRGQEAKTKEDRETDELYKKVRGILNKLTPQKFDTLVLQFQNLPINSLERMQGTIRLVFEKAIDEPAFSISYANLCKVLARLQVYETPQIAAAAAAAAAAAIAANQEPPKAQPVLFRKLLITRCQQEFETNKKLELDFEKRQIDINATPEPDKRKELQLLFNEEERKIRVKSVGLVTFIGELFKLKMLTANIMHGCIKQLLMKIDEESLECLCKLLTTIGREFEEQILHKSGQGGINEFNDYFQQMAKLSRKHEGSKVSSRVRFMLQDVIELRQNNWVPRRDENKPRTMEQIQQEVDRESEKAAMLAAQPLRMQNMNQDRGSRRGNTRVNNNQSEDGWTSVSSKYSRNTNYAAEASKIQGLRTTANMELERGSRGEPVLGSSTGFNRWSAGAGTTPSRVQQSSAAAFTDTNSFSALLDSGDRKQGPAGSRFSALKMTNDSKEADKKEALLTTAAFMRQPAGERDSPRDNSRGRGASGSSPSPSLSGPMRKPPSLIEQPTSRPADMQRRTQSDTGRGGSTESSRESTPGLMSNLVDKSRIEPAPVPAAPPVDEDKLKQSATTIIEEYISNVNIQESVECYKEQFADAGALFVSTCLNYIVDQMKREKRQKTSQLMGELMKHQQFPPSLLVAELQLFFEMIYDFAVDVPHIWEYLGELFGDIMCIGVMDFSHLKEASQPIPDSSSDTNRLDGTLREVFRVLLLEKVPMAVKKLWDSSNVQLEDFISDKSASDQFLVDYAFLEGKEVVASDSKLPFTKVEEKLLDFLKSDENFDQICGWLTVHVGKRTAEPVFIRHLTEAVIKSSVSVDSVSKSYKFDKNILNKNLKFIKRYVDNNEELELWCLYSVQYVVVISLESPSGMLVEIFRELYESSVISPEGFSKWQQDDSICLGWMKEGRGVAVTTSKSFFQAIEEQMNDDQEDEPS